MNRRRSTFYNKNILTDLLIMLNPHWLTITKAGLYCIPGQFYIDPVLAVNKAIITHAHADHARGGHQQVLAHPITIDLMKLRYGEEAASYFQALEYEKILNINGIQLYLLPAGHIFGSAQVVMEYKGLRVVVSGDYKRAYDPTAAAFMVKPCDILITEATFGLPIFKHPPVEEEIKKLLASLTSFPNRCHLVGVYTLGKCQRLLAMLRLMSYVDPIYLHGALKKPCQYYTSQGFNFGILLPAESLSLQESAGKIVLCPPSALHDRWSRRFTDKVVSMASGWMQIRARAKQKGVELPLVISDHADWPELTKTISDINPQAIWVTHGREEALVYHAQKQGYHAKALHLLGYEEHED